MGLNKRGQVFASDLFVSMMIFLVLFGLCIMAWQNTSNRMTERAVMRELNTASIQAAEILAKTEGTPRDWATDANNTITLGLLEHDTVSDGKLEALAELDYASLRSLVGAGNYDIYVGLRDLDDEITYACGRETAGEYAATARKLVKTRDGYKVLEVTVWTESPLKGGLV